MIFAPPRTRGIAIACGLAAVAAALGLALLVRGFTLHVSFAAYLAYTLGGLLIAAAFPLAYWAYAIATMRYELRQGSVAIRWGAAEHIIPVREVQRIVLGRHLAVPEGAGLRLPGVAVGQGRVPKLGTAIVYARYRGPEDMLYLITGAGPVGIALAEAQPFVRALQQAQSEPAASEVSAGLRRGALGSLGLWSDRRVLALGGLALLLAWAAVGIVFSRFQGLPRALTVHFPSTEVAHLAPRDRLLQIPESAVVLFAVSALAAVLLFNRARVISYLVLAGAAASGALLMIAAIGATG